MRKLLIIVAIIAVLLAGASIVAASIPDSEGTIHGCYRNSNGDLKVIDSAAVCPSGYTALNWQQQAPIPVLNRQRVFTEGIPRTIDAGSGLGLSLACPTGTDVTGGGFTIDDQAAVRVVQSNPDSTQGGTSWSVRVVADGDPLVDPPVTFTLQVWAVCVALDNNM